MGELTPVYYQYWGIHLLIYCHRSIDRQMNVLLKGYIIILIILDLNISIAQRRSLMRDKIS